MRRRIRWFPLERPEPNPVFLATCCAIPAAGVGFLVTYYETFPRIDWQAAGFATCLTLAFAALVDLCLSGLGWRSWWHP